MDRETLKRIVSEKLKKNNGTGEGSEGNSSGVQDKSDCGTFGTFPYSTPQTSGEFSSKDRETNSIVALRNTETNPNNSGSSHQNSPEVSREHGQKVPKVPQSNLPRTPAPKLSGTFGTFPYSTPQTSGEINSEQDEETEGVEIKYDKIVIQTKDRHRLEIYYGLAGSVEDATRIIDLKVPQLPRWEFVAKKKGETLNISVVVDFYQVEGRTIYYIKNKKEIVEKLYAFRSQKHVTKDLISNALDAWLDHINPEKYIQWADIIDVVKQYDEWEEITRDPVSFFLSRSDDVVGNEKLKIAVLLSVVSSQLTKIKRGIYRVHLILSGASGSGKSSTVKSIVDLFYDNADTFKDYVVLKLTRMTKEALGRIDVESLDGKVIFVEQLDNMEGVDYLREAMSEDRITTLTTVKDSEGNLVSKTLVIPGQPAFITTNVTANVDHQIVNRSIQLYLSQAEDEKLKSKIIETILEREDVEDMNKVKLVTYVWLKTRPKSPKMTTEVKRELMRLLSRFINFKNIYRASEITRNLVRATASMFDHKEVTMNDVNFVMNYLKKDIILTTLELSERDLHVMRWLRDHGFIQGESDDETKDVTTSEIAQVLKMSTQESKKLLDVLYDKGLVWKVYDGKRFSWAVNHYGLKVLSELEREVQEEQREEGGVIIEDQLLSYISSKLIGKETVNEEELRSILQRTAQATDIETQDLLIEGLEKKRLIKNQGDGTWKVL
jgi:ABC-type dipeptide/oligopeptide/nickel transport system ATPase component